jgi:hypothetical protein
MITPAAAVLDQKLRAAGIPIVGVRGDLSIDYDVAATPAQKTQGGNIAAAFDGLARRPRPILAIYQQLLALTATQKTAIGNDLFAGSPMKVLTDTGANAAAIAVLHWGAVNAGLAAAAVTDAKLRAAACYAQDNPQALVNPVYDASINVPGDEPV